LEHRKTGINNHKNAVVIAKVVLYVANSRISQVSMSVERKKK
jgi:hypothetical protein